MRTSYVSFGCWAVVVGTCLAVGAFSEDAPISGSTEPMRQLATLPAEGRQQLLLQCFETRQSLERELIGQFDVAQADDVRCDIAYALGLYRMEGAVGALSRHIKLRSAMHRRRPLGGEYPAVDALGRIGNPAIPEMIKNIENSDDPQVQELSLRVIRYVEGAEVCKFVLQLAIDKQADKEKKGRLSSALDAITK